MCRYLLVRELVRFSPAPPPPFSNESANSRTRLRQVAEAAIELGYLTTNPVTSVPTPKATAEDRRAKRVLIPAEIHRLLRALNPENRYDAAICLLYTSGIRVSEALGLAWSDLDLHAGTANLRRGCTCEGGGVGSRLDDIVFSHVAHGQAG